MDAVYELQTFHQDNVAKPVTVARAYALLLYGKKRKDIDTLDALRYMLATTTNKSASMLPPTEDAFMQHVLRARYQTRIWCESLIVQQELIDPVGHGWSACVARGITQTMSTQPSVPVEVHDLTPLLHRQGLFGRKCPCLLAGRECIEACSCTDCENQND